MKTLAMASLILSISALSACGGGGGGGNSALEYTGETSQAVITADNADQLATSSYSGASSGMIASSALAVDTETGSHPLPPTVAPLVQLVDAMLYAPVDTGLPDTASAAVVDPPIYAPCGGQMVVARTSNVFTFAGTITASDFCAAGVTVTGTLVVNGTISGGSIETAVLTYDRLRISGMGSATVSSGEMSAKITGSVMRMDLDEKTLVEDSGLVYWLQGGKLVVASSGTTTTISMSGRYYDPLYGYVDLTTPSALTLYPDTANPWPSAGQMVITGLSADGTNSATVTLTAQGSSYLLELDSNGDGMTDLTLNPDWPSTL